MRLQDDKITFFWKNDGKSQIWWFYAFLDFVFAVVSSGVKRRLGVEKWFFGAQKHLKKDPGWGDFEFRKGDFYVPEASFTALINSKNLLEFFLAVFHLRNKHLIIVRIDGDF